MSGKLLFISGCVGLGHVLKDMMIVDEIRQLDDGISIKWLAGSLAAKILKDAGEEVLPENERFGTLSPIFEKLVPQDHYALSLAHAFREGMETWNNEVELMMEVQHKYQFDLIVGDETLNIPVAIGNSYRNGIPLLKTPFVYLSGYLGFQSNKVFDRNQEGTYPVPKIFQFDKEQINDLLSLSTKANYLYEIQPWKEVPVTLLKRFLIGMDHELPDEPFYGTDISIKKFAKANEIEAVGYIIPKHDIQPPVDKNSMRTSLGWDQSPVIVCTSGGTSVAAKLHELVVEAYKLTKPQIPNLKLILVKGKDYPINIDQIDGIETYSYIPELYRYFIASDLVISHGGSTTLTELIHYNTPFIHFPIEGHWEQWLTNAKLLYFGIDSGLEFSKTNAECLSTAILKKIGAPVSYKSIDTRGAEVIAKYIVEHI